MEIKYIIQTDIQEKIPYKKEKTKKKIHNAGKSSTNNAMLSQKKIHLQNSLSSVERNKDACRVRKSLPRFDLNESSGRFQRIYIYLCVCVCVYTYTMYIIELYLVKCLHFKSSEESGFTRLLSLLPVPLGSEAVLLETYLWVNKSF